MSKPINENIRFVRIENASGDLIPVLDHAGDMFSTLVKSVTEHNKAGTLTMRISLKPSTAGALAVKAEVSSVLPKGLPPEALLWPTPEGNLIAEDPRQSKLNLHPVLADPARELVSAAS